MKIIRTTKCSLKFSNKGKLEALNKILTEYGRVVNCFIDQFWENCPRKMELLKPVVDSVDTWFSARLRKVAAREAIDMVLQCKNRRGKKSNKPTHRGARMCVSSTIAEFQEGQGGEFDNWLKLWCIGEKIVLEFPLKLHKQFRKLSFRGKRLNYYLITKDYVQFWFEIETGPKKEITSCLGIDTGINVLCTVSNGCKFGEDLKTYIEDITRKLRGSRGQKRASRTLRQYMDEIAKEVIKDVTLVVVEKLTNITQNTKRRLGKNMRRSIGSWNVGYWLKRLEMTCEDRNVSFRTVSPYYTSQTCSVCGYVDRKNRSGELFHCLKCGHEANADVQASQNILNRFFTGPYGAGCKPLTVLKNSVYLER